MSSNPNSFADPSFLIQDVFSSLEQHYGWFTWWPSDNPFEIMLGAILVQNTNWRNADKALANLGDDLLPQRIEAMEPEELAQRIRPSGYFNQKAQRLKAVTHWFAGYQFDIDKVRQCDTGQLRSELLAIKGIGGETADVILTYAIGHASFVIDAYARRIFSRYGLAVPKGYEPFRALMQGALPTDVERYAYYHGLMVEHGQQFCNKTPRCDGCPLYAGCRQIL
jgi:endonuclease-3 related protein